MISTALTSKLLRFCFVGGGAAIFYAICTFSGIKFIGLHEITASIFGYLISIPVSFVGHKYFTFRSKGEKGTEISLFIITHLFGLFLSTMVIACFAHASFSPVYGVIFVTVVVPVMSFILMNYVVFPLRARKSSI